MVGIQSVSKKIISMSALPSLIAGTTKHHVGYVFSMSYGEARVLTNDSWRERVGGIPQNSFLIATAFDPDKFAEAPESDKTIVLLRVMGPTPLPQDGDMVKAVIQHHQNRTAISRADTLDGFDPFTHNQIQYAGLLCRIVGSFYMEGIQLQFGADVEDFFSASHLRVYCPAPEVLKQIVNYADPIRLAKAFEDGQRLGFKKLPAPFEIGHVRYTSANRMQKTNGVSSVPVYVQPMDFLARRTAVLGMTRTGKSNTVKTMVSAVAISATEAQVPVGQLIFDMNGEYANANQQDAGSSIADVFSDNTVRYRGLPTTGFSDLRNNFYESLEAGLEILQNVLSETVSGSQPDQQAFLSLSLQEPPRSEAGNHLRWQKQVALYRCILNKAGFDLGGRGGQLRFTVAEDIFVQMYDVLYAPPAGRLTKAQKADQVKQDYGDPGAGLTHTAMERFLLKAREASLIIKNDRGRQEDGLLSSSGNLWFDPPAQALANLLAQENNSRSYINGWNLFQVGKAYHSPAGSNNIPQDIYNHLQAGRIVIMDLSVGSESVRNTMALKIADYILAASSMAFNEGKTPPSVVIYVEEAHNLIGKEAKLDETWPRIAKEGAKFGISLVYSTQEPSSIHPNIMANTENLFVTHLNNEKEIRALSDYYDFGDFGESIKKAQDVGFARVKTLSAPFVVPTQIKRFEPAAIKGVYDKMEKAQTFKPVSVPAVVTTAPVQGDC